MLIGYEPVLLPVGGNEAPLGFHDDGVGEDEVRLVGAILRRLDERDFELLVVVGDAPLFEEVRVLDLQSRTEAKPVGRSEAALALEGDQKSP